MLCLYPQQKHRVIKGNRYTYQHACGACIACRVRRRYEWAARIQLEAALWPANLFVTLTYDDEHVPLTPECVQTLRKEDVPEFMRAMRYRADRRLRFYACGEYGSQTLRPHYHLVLFGLGLEAIPWIEQSWKNGFCSVAELTPTRAAYVARYTTKKMTSQDSFSDGRAPEFGLMSRRPGVGHGILRSVADTWKRASCLSDSGPSGGGQKKATMNTLPVSLRLQGRIYPLDRYCRQKLKEYLSVEEPLSDQAKAHAAEYRCRVEPGLDVVEVVSAVLDAAALEQKLRSDRKRSTEVL